MRQNGFTLLEVMIALTVAAVALITLVISGSQYSDHTAHLRNRTFAHWVAMNEAAKLTLQKNTPAVGHTSGTAEMGKATWEWQTDISTTADPRVRKAVIKVYLSGKQDTPLEQLTTFLAISQSPSG